MIDLYEMTSDQWMYLFVCVHEYFSIIRCYSQDFQAEVHSFLRFVTHTYIHTYVSNKK